MKDVNNLGVQGLGPRVLVFRDAQALHHGPWSSLSLNTYTQP